MKKEKNNPRSSLKNGFQGGKIKTFKAKIQNTTEMWNLEMGEVKEDSGLALEKFVAADREKEKKK